MNNNVSRWLCRQTYKECGTPVLVITKYLFSINDNLLHVVVKTSFYKSLNQQNNLLHVVVKTSLYKSLNQQNNLLQTGYSADLETYTNLS
jgi:GTP:adenosylcobinamide-phosphate guanylyltransferase